MLWKTACCCLLVCSGSVPRQSKSRAFARVRCALAAVSELAVHRDGQPQAAAVDSESATPLLNLCCLLPLSQLSQFIDTGSPKPLLDVITYGFVFSYALSWPRE